MKCSIVISTLDRVPLLDTTLTALCRWQSYSPHDVELILVVDRTKVWDAYHKVLHKYRSYFYKITFIEIDSLRSTVPLGVSGNPALGVNIAVKHAENDMVIKTDAECLPITETVQESMRLFRKDRLWFYSMRWLTPEETAYFTLEEMEHVHPVDIYATIQQFDGLWYVSGRNRLPYWFGAVFSKEIYMKVGGVDEEFMKGFAGEDDEWAERLARNGIEWCWTNDLQILHQYHGSFTKANIHTPGHFININRLKWARENAVLKANENMDWGSDTVVLRKEVIKCK